MKNFILLLACGTMIFASCSKDLDSLPANRNEAVMTKSLITEENNMLQFESMDSFQATLNDLKEMSKEDVILWSDTKDFTSMYKLFTEVDSCIDNVKNSEEYRALRDQYSSTFIFNNEDYYDLTMYLPTQDWHYSKIINAQGEVMIGGKVYSFKDFKNYNDYKKVNNDNLFGAFTDKKISTFADKIVLNECGLTSNHQKRKFHVIARWDTNKNCVAFGLNASSKFLWGWKSLSTQYYCTGLAPAYEAIWGTPEMPSGSTWWSPLIARNADYYIYTRSFGPEGRQLIRIRL